MSQSLAKIYIHLIFSTKKREPFLQDSTVRQALHAYMAGILQQRQSQVFAIGGTADHQGHLMNLPLGLCFWMK